MAPCLFIESYTRLQYLSCTKDMELYNIRQEFMSTDSSPIPSSPPSIGNQRGGSHSFKIKGVAFAAPLLFYCFFNSNNMVSQRIIGG